MVVRRRLGGFADGFPDPTWFIVAIRWMDEHPWITPEHQSDGSGEILGAEPQRGFDGGLQLEALGKGL
jgi:hypothetical protein